MSFATGSIVRARGREWVVLPQGNDPSLILVKPLGGHEAEVTGILPSLESVSAASFAPPLLLSMMFSGLMSPWHSFCLSQA